MRDTHALRDRKPGIGSGERSRSVRRVLPLPADPFFYHREAQSRAKHDLLERYAGAWAGIILRGLARMRREGMNPFEINLVFLDGFAGAGRYGRDVDKPPPGVGDEPIWGSPVLALRAINKAAGLFPTLNISVSALLIERKPDNFKDLLDSLDASGLQDVEAQTTGEIQPGTIGVVNGDFKEHLPAFLESLPSSAYLLAFLDPYGPAAPMTSMEALLARPKTDSIILFPYRDLLTRGGSSLKPEAERAPSDSGNVTRYDEHFGTSAWQEIAADPELGDEEKMRAWVGLFTEQLGAIHPETVVKEIGLRSAKDPARPVYYLCMTTANESGALKFNKLIRETAAQEELEIWRDQEAWLRRADADQGQTSFLDQLGGPELYRPPELEMIVANADDVRMAIANLFGDDEVREVKDVLKGMSRFVYTKGEIEKALRAMRKDDEAEFSKLNVTSEIAIRKP